MAEWLVVWVWLADVVPATPVLPDWIPPSVLVVIGLAVAAGYLNQKGFWASGRELRDRLVAQAEGHAAELRGKDATIALLRDQLAKADGRAREERVERIADAQAMAELKRAAQVARSAMTSAADVAEGLNDRLNDTGQSYAERLAPHKRTKRPGTSR